MNSFLKRIGLFSLLMITIVAINRKSITAGLFKTGEEAAQLAATGNGQQNNPWEKLKGWASKVIGKADKMFFTWGSSNAEKEARMDKLTAFATSLQGKIHDTVQNVRGTLSIANFAHDPIMASILQHAHKICDAIESKAARIVQDVQEGYRGQPDVVNKETAALAKKTNPLNIQG